MPETNNNEAASILVSEMLKEKRAERRWKNIRFLFWFALSAYSIIGIFSYFGSPAVPVTPTANKYVALVRMDGMISPDSEISAEQIVPILHDAFKDKNSSGVVIDINSPGGTPVQASIIHDAILAYKKKYHKKVIIVGEDLLTSGAYFISVSADRIYVNPNTITGSIGVIMKGFGFVDAMKKIGVERRVYTAGIAKDRLDPFLPQNPEDLKKIHTVMSEVHQNFVKAVVDGRKGKLKADPETLFNGDFWSGQSAVNLGLVDGLGNLMDVMNLEFKTTEYKEFGGSSNFFRMLAGQLNSAFDSLFFVRTSLSA
ncbi:Putative signal peptide peptidase SppA [Aquicella siphonis]|uniref:Signal peptide peptidase SppA n=2 Tax=Aquicella siphonis TaxID=254247 RepID=A0A5E4PK99_9COXI|nr:Putative signal peptide peptidase SppA [Aquicella siphonis]